MTAEPPWRLPLNHMTESRLARKVKKLVRNPESFLSDSRHAPLQRLGGLLKSAPRPFAREPDPIRPMAFIGGPLDTPSAVIGAPSSPALQNADRLADRQRLEDHAEDLDKLAGFAVALAATDYPVAGDGVIMGRTSYRRFGLEFLHHFIEWGELTPDDDVLDVGCGGGRMAAALGYYLSSSSQYIGFDIHRTSVDWCRENITSRWPHFRFEHFDIENSHYNPGGAVDQLSFTFPYEAGSFSFVIATSVFTHLLRREVKHYLHEIARILRPGGRLFATAFLIRPALDGTYRRHEPELMFQHRFGENYVQTLERPLAGVAQHEDAFVADLVEAGLVLDRVGYGRWSGLNNSNSMQDIVVLRKP